MRLAALSHRRLAKQILTVVPALSRDPYAYCRKKICIGLKTDVLSLLPIGDNPMVECALRATFSDIYDVSEWIRSKRWEKH